jgi:Flp pilus assembly protein CpaB
MDLRLAQAARRLGVRRRLVVAVLTGIAVVCALTALRPAAVATRGVWVAARDLSGGEPLADADVRVEQLPSGDVPSAAVPTTVPVVGRMLAAPMRQGEPLTDVRLLSPSLLAATGDGDVVAVPVRVADGPAALALVHAGDLVDVIAVADASDGVASPDSAVVHDVRVLATPSRGDAASSGSADSAAGLLIVEATHHQAAALAQAAVSQRLSVAVRQP